MTKEHIWPAGFIRRSGFDLSYSRKANAAFGGDLTTKDVCRECNNSYLSNLDEYACQLYDRYFALEVRRNQEIEFAYDFSRLARWLLKLSYNSSRATGEDSETLGLYVPVIACENPVTPVFVAIAVGTARSYTGVTNAGRMKTIEATGFRCAQIKHPMVDLTPYFCLRYVQINAYVFTFAAYRILDLPIAIHEMALACLHGQILQFSGRMTINPPAWTARDALKGVESWPRRKGRAVPSKLR